MLDRKRHSPSVSFSILIVFSLFGAYLLGLAVPVNATEAVIYESPISGQILVVPNEDEDEDETSSTFLATDEGVILQVEGAGIGEADAGNYFEGQILVDEGLKAEAEALTTDGRSDTEDEVYSAEGEPEDYPTEDVGTQSEDLLGSDDEALAQELDKATEEKNEPEADAIETENLDEAILEIAQTREEPLQISGTSFEENTDDTQSNAIHEIDILWLNSTNTNVSTTGLKEMGDLAGQYWAQQSMGQINRFTTRNIKVATANVNLCEYAPAITEGLKQFGKTYSDYYNTSSHLVVVVPENACTGNIIGRANVGPGIDGGGTIWVRAQANAPSATWERLAHEIGHNLGLGHSNVLSCPDVSVDAPTAYADFTAVGCRTLAYMDYYDVMGAAPRPSGGQLAALNVSHRVQLGVLSEGNGLQNVTADGGPSQIIKLSGTSSYSGTIGLSIVDPQTNEKIYVEYRDGQGLEQSSYYQKQAASYPQSRYSLGVRFLRLWEEPNYGNGYYYSNVIQRYRSNAEKALWYGKNDTYKSYSKDANGQTGVSVTVLDLSSGVATLKVDFNGGKIPFEGIGSAKISGNLYVSSTLKAEANQSTWTPSATSFKFQWLRSGKPIAGATKSTYTVSVADCGKPLAVNVSGVRSGYLDAVTTSSTVVPKCPTMVRLGGDTRYDTAVKISEKTYPNGNLQTVYISTGQEFADALAAAPVAAKDGAPMLLVPAKGNLPESVKKEIRRLSPDKIVIVGGTNAVSKSMENQITATMNRVDVSRIFGATRYETAKKLVEKSFDGTTSNVFVTTGRDFPDALSASAAAGVNSSPIILVDGKSTTLDRSVTSAIKNLRPQKIFVIGGVNAVSSQIESQLRSTGIQVQRVKGDTRYETSVKVAEEFFFGSNRSLEVSDVYWATGSNFPDALAGAPAAAVNNSPLYVVRPGCIGRSVFEQLQQKMTSTVMLLGGQTVLNQNVESLTACP